MAIPKFQSDSAVLFRIETRNAALENELSDPTGGAQLTIYRPDGTELVSSATMVSGGAGSGRYSYSYVLQAADPVGVYGFKFKLIDSGGGFSVRGGAFEKLEDQS